MGITFGENVTTYGNKNSDLSRVYAQKLTSNYKKTFFFLRNLKV